MSMLDDDLAVMHADALALGMATSATYGSGATAITTTFQEIPQPFIHAEGAEVRRRECTIDVRRSVIASPAKDDPVVVAAGPYTGTWHVIEISSADDGEWLLTVRLDDRLTMGTARRLPTGGA